MISRSSASGTERWLNEGGRHSTACQSNLPHMKQYRNGVTPVDSDYATSLNQYLVLYNVTCVKSIHTSILPELKPANRILEGNLGAWRCLHLDIRSVYKQSCHFWRPIKVDQYHEGFRFDNFAWRRGTFWRFRCEMIAFYFHAAFGGSYRDMARRPAEVVVVIWR